MTKLNQFSIIGISFRTTNENGQAAIDIPQLWAKLLSEETITKIPNQIDDAVYSIYTDYELDYTKPYTTILGCKVSILENIPEGMVGKVIEASEYEVYTAKENLAKGVFYREWEKIWHSNIARKYAADFEIYGPKSSNPQDPEVPVFISV
jgi:predicted transcriptional regulator YdeE